MRVLVLGILALCAAGPATAQVVRHGSHSPSPMLKAAIPVEPCDLAGQPSTCASCPSLIAALRLPGASTGDTGPDLDGVVWSPLYVAFRLGCRDAGTLLVSRGANPERGGKAGALLTEIAAQHFLVPNSRPAATQAAALDWLAILAKPRPFDLDAPIGDGMPNSRASWVALRVNEAVPPGSSVVWSRIESLSANFPVLMDGGERTSVDQPAPDTGLTRPSETAVSRGVDAMLVAKDRGGIVEVAIQVQTCWSETQPSTMTRARWRWHLDVCAAMDVSASVLDAAVPQTLNGPRYAFFEEDPVLTRLSALNTFRPDGLQFSPYLHTLRRSVRTWLPIQLAIRFKE